MTKRAHTETDGDPICAVCLSGFNFSRTDNSVPCLLACGHTFHRNCIAATKSPSPNRISCPCCRWVTIGSANALKPNYSLLEALKFYQPSSELPPTSASSVSTTAETSAPQCCCCSTMSTFYCENCEGFFCNQHNTSTHPTGVPILASHKRISAAEKISQQKSIVKCIHHPFEETKLFCTQCKVPVCFYCPYDSQHNSHSCVLIESVVTTVKQEIQKEQQDFDEKVAQLEKTVKYQRDTEAKLEEATKKVLEQIITEEKEIIEAVRANSKVLQAQVKEYTNSQQIPLKKQREQFSELISQLQKMKEETQNIMKRDGAAIFPSADAMKGKLQQFKAASQQAITTPIVGVVLPTVPSSLKQQLRQESPEFTIFIKFMHTRRTRALRALPIDTVGKIKQWIEDNEGIPIKQQHLGNFMKPFISREDVTLNQYGIGANSTLYVTLCKPREENTQETKT